MALDEKDRRRHLLRRFGLGAGRYETRRYERSGKAPLSIDDLIEEARTDDFPIDPWEFAAQEDGRIDTGAYQLSGWWALRMLMTRRPLQERMTLFWHDHFAVDYEKVFEMPMMAGYLEVLRRHGLGRFGDLLEAVFLQGALYSYLDQHASNRIHPNENFARELLELFTVGLGNFEEKDVAELARALTGWSVHYLGIGIDMEYEKLRTLAARNGMGLMNACHVPALHDAREKTILGKTAKWEAMQALAMLAKHPKTAEHICGKLWDWFAAKPASSETMKRLQGAWNRSNGEIAAVLRAIAEAPQFWDEDEVGRKPKCPIESVVSLYRCFDVTDILLLARGAQKSPQTPIRMELRGAAGALSYLMSLQGMTLLLPPNVGGWEWGSAWINPALSIERLKLPGVVFWGGDDRPMTSLLSARILQDLKPTTSEQLVRGIADILDLDLPQEAMPALIATADRHGGVKALANRDQAAGLFTDACRLLFAVPAAQLY